MKPHEPIDQPSTTASPDTEPTKTELRQFLDATWMPILVQRARATSAILFTGTLAFSLAALTVFPSGERSILRVHGLHAMLQALVFLAVPRVDNLRLLRWLPATGAIVTTWVVAWGATMLGHTETTALVVGGYLMGAGALMPWGLGRQIAVVGLALGAFAANVYAVTGGGFFAAGYWVSIPVLMMAGTSLYMAAVFDRTRETAGREELRLLRAQQALTAANASLEQHVAERTRDLERVVEELRSFSYTVSHDLRSPLRSINGFSQALVEDYGDALGDDGKAILARVQAATRRMGGMIDAMLALGRVTSSEITPVRVHLSKMAAEIARDLRLDGVGPKVEWVIHPDMEASGDTVLLHLMLENLLANACKFTRDAESPRVEFGCERLDGVPTWFVRDNGVGFDMEHAHHLFQEFSRLHHGDQFEGTGIGLATVRRIVDRHGGHVWADGEPGKGATFRFTLGSATS